MTWGGVKAGLSLSQNNTNSYVYIASCSFGKDSLAMVLKILEEGLPLNEVIFFDTGMEFDSIYHNRDKMKRILAERNILFTELSSKNHFLFDMFVRPVKYRNPENKPYPIHYGYEWCGARGIRWGTSGKLAAIMNHYKEYYPDKQIVEYVGIAADELGRINHNQRNGVIKKYPLVDWKMTEKDCLTYCYEHGWNWDEVSPVMKEGYVDLYSILDRVSCYACQNKNLRELKNIYMYLPEYWQRLRGLQSRIDSPFKGVGKSVFQLEERFKREIEESSDVK